MHHPGITGAFEKYFPNIQAQRFSMYPKISGKFLLGWSILNALQKSNGSAKSRDDWRPGFVKKRCSAPDDQEDLN
jgi:hypothetical protein